MQVSRNLRTASTVMAWLSLVAAIAMAVSTTIGILYPFEIHHGGLNLAVQLTMPNGAAITQATPPLYRAAVFAMALVPVGLRVWMLLSLGRAFRLFAAGHIFDAITLSCIGRVASLLAWMVISEIAVQPAILFVMGKAVGQFWLGYLISGDELPNLFAAGVVLVIARVMTEAQRLADENAKFV